MKWLVVIIALMAALAFLSFGLGGRGHSAVSAVGSTSIQPFAEMLAQEFNKAHPDSLVDVQGGGSTAGLQAAAEGIADIGLCSRALKKDEAQVFTAVTIARDGLAIVVHPSNPVSGLSLGEIRRMFAAYDPVENPEPIARWSQVPGGQDVPVRLIVREEGSGTREAFVKLVMGKCRISRQALNQESNGAVKELVKHDPCAIGFMSLGLVAPGELKALKIDGVTPSTAEVAAGRYPLVRPFLFVTKGPPSVPAQRFIDYVLSAPAQRVLEKEGLVGVK